LGAARRVPANEIVGLGPGVLAALSEWSGLPRSRAAVYREHAALSEDTRMRAVRAECHGSRPQTDV